MIGRSYEIKQLEEIYNSNSSELGIVYGRRRVGKSFLLKSFVRNTRGDLFFEAIRNLRPQAQIDHFCKQLAEQTKSFQAKVRTWQEAFDVLTLFLEKGKHFVVFDELPWMAGENLELISIFKYYWDNKWKDNSKIKMILCGSIAQFMIKHVLHSEALHNRKTFEMKMGPLSSDEAIGFFKNKRSQLEVTKHLISFGGIPKYLEQIRPNDSYKVNMNRLCFRKNAFFLNEFDTIFKEQFKVFKKYEVIVKALAQKPMTREQLIKELKYSLGGSLNFYLNNLEHADFIKKRTALDITTLKKKNKTIKYYLWDEWLRFYFNFVEPHIDLIQESKENNGLEQFAKNIESYWGLGFERFCEKNISKIFDALNLSLGEIISYGPIFHQPKRGKVGILPKGFQIDLAILRRDKILTLVECKFTQNPIGVEVVREMERKLSHLHAPKSITIEKVLISANGVTKDLESCDFFNHIFGLEIFYK